ncbi:hypothetical protein BJI67_10075 [Acidihalobacter aeolianus]|uniref:DUF4412 domain-containing protein n=1 Tax=Acidihalobacter aeolianus TaxID=2792603 RepID=A0A1D8K8R9_9GAMM|nr:hypothetical protein [Acidihalobacter aeolianus]AOV17358.1 hypothetical protein BJI67_10075 [Acidihalobacter aeolianus]
MMRWAGKWLVLRSLGLFVGCLLSAAVMAATTSQSGPATVVQYREFPHGRPPYVTRLLVTPGYIRFDEGRAQGNYMLFVRATRTLYSVDRGDGTVLVIAPRKVAVKSPIPLKLSKRYEQVPGAPRIGGRQALHYTFYANGDRCMDAMVVPGLLDGVRRALMTYKATLAGQQAADLDKTPRSMQTACSLADLIFAPDRVLRLGMPIVEWHPNGDRKELTDYRHGADVRAALFALPSDYRYYRIGAQGMAPAQAPLHLPSPWPRN